MKSKAILANLQTNAAAFEAWCLALRVWCEVEKIELRWQQPADNSPNEQCHYQRFLYRVERFRSLFPSWFSSRPGAGCFQLPVREKTLLRVKSKSELILQRREDGCLIEARRERMARPGIHIEIQKNVKSTFGYDRRTSYRTPRSAPGSSGVKQDWALETDKIR
jgi:hypothetical protein